MPRLVGNLEDDIQNAGPVEEQVSVIPRVLQVLAPLLVELVGIVKEWIDDPKSHEHQQGRIRALTVDPDQVSVVDVNGDDEYVNRVHQGTKVVQSEGMCAPLEKDQLLEGLRAENLQILAGSVLAKFCKGHARVGIRALDARKQVECVSDLVEPIPAPSISAI